MQNLESLNEFNSGLKCNSDNLRKFFQNNSFEEIFNFVEFVIRHKECPNGFYEKINNALSQSQSAYKIINEDTITPITSEHDIITLENAYKALRNADKFSSAKTHLSKACSMLTAGDYHDSIRESIHAVESICRVITKEKNFKDALNKLVEKFYIHKALKDGMNNIYGYTSDQGGVRHPFIDSESKVDQADALYMLGVCSAFITYVVNKTSD